jgi:hypothetical protein
MAVGSPAPCIRILCIIQPAVSLALLRPILRHFVTFLLTADPLVGLDPRPLYLVVWIDGQAGDGNA